MDKKWIQRNYSYWFLVPGVLIFFVFFAVPSLQSFYYSLTYWDGIRPARFIGLANFVNLFAVPDHATGIKNTIIFTVFTSMFKVGLGFALALFINNSRKISLFTRSVLFFPVILSTVAVGLAFTVILHPNGVLNQFFREIHLGFLAQDWLVDRNIVMYSISAVEVWKYSGLHMVFFLAGLQTIPREVHESAVMDGAGHWQKFRSVTLPLMVPVLNTNIIFSLIGGLKVFDIVMALTNGGPGFASNVINNIVYRNFAEGRYGEATAATVLLFLMIVAIVLTVQRWLKTMEKEV